MNNRSYPDRPIVGVGALIVEDGRILLVRRGKEPLKGDWSLPGGVQETGETLAEAVRREVREETGLEIEPQSVAIVFDRIIRDAQGRAEYHYVLVDYLCKRLSGELRPGDDVDDARWVSRAELESYEIVPYTREIILKHL